MNPANSISATSSGFNQCIPVFLRGASLPPNGLVADAAAFSFGISCATFSDAIARSDIADIDQVIASVYAGHQRAELACVAVPAADDHFVPRAALGLCPGIRSSRGVGSESQFRDDALQRHAASRFEDRIAAGFEMLDVANFSLILPVRLVDQFL